MKTYLFCRIYLSLSVIALSAGAATLVVNTTNNVSPGANEISLVQALTQAQSGDTIQFNIPGTGIHYIPTPPNGYPYIQVNDLTIDGYSQPGAGPNTNSIHQANNARIKIVLDSRNKHYTSMNYLQDPGGSSPGYGQSESSILGVVDASGVEVKGLAFLGSPIVDTYIDGNDGSSNYVHLYAIALAVNTGPTDGTHVDGCWFGVDPANGTTVATTAYGITGFGNSGANNTVIGVGNNSVKPRAEFNVFVGQAIPAIIEGDNTRVSGNFMGVFPDGLHDYIVSFVQNTYLNTNYANYGDSQFQGNLELGDHTTALIGTDGDGVNDADEGNVFGGAIPDMTLNGVSYAGYSHHVAFYGGPRSAIVVAGNYFGIGVDGVTRFTNGVPALDTSGGAANYRFGSDFDGVSDAVEGNVVYNNWPQNLFSATGTNTFAALLPDNLNFFDDLSTGAAVSARGNSMVNNLPFPVSPTKSAGGVSDAFLTNYLSQVLLNTDNGILPVLSTSTSSTNLIGSVPVANAGFSVTMIDLYIPDPEGITNGEAAAIPELPNGFVQGRTYLASFVVDGPNDLDPAPGAFRFNLAGINLKGASSLTITANYSSAPAGTHNALTLTSPFSAPVNIGPPSISGIQRSGSNLIISWTGGNPPFQVARSTSLTGIWTIDPTAVYSGNSATVTMSGNSYFYRIQGK